MIHALDYFRELNFASVVLRLTLAMLTGGMIGLERVRKRRPAGFRTYMLVCLGASLTMLLSQYEATMLETRWAELAAEIGLRTDVSRFGAQVINGIGFLGAGTILVTGHQEVKGLTTAAGLWASACTGLAVGAGFYECVLLACPLIFLCMRLFPLIDALILENAREINLYVEFESLDNIGEILNRIKAQGGQILDIELDRSQDKWVRYPSAVLFIHLNSRQTHTQMLSSLSGLDCIHTVQDL
ncbi:MAG: MgtC/SapB family protein [Butyricicoccus sp.]